MAMNIDPQVEQDLTKIAARHNMSVNTLLSKFTAKENKYWQEYEEDKATLEAMKKGDYIEHEDMMNWLDNLDKGLDV